ncbi:M28 family metallopeptidase [Fonticella tunisiensis]|uniref:Zn-dependent M28 family amino/carboxypeptidase n=1 Tax=Fonticella tunisiensis TaxID=1096341 RepID=A0A4R7KVL0_9CLOT|nr:M28 family peptidase [Fonticella tunisiensis]TDT62423.1 Zn-dependent M28 family amino/carboxypeptidase [Fonticella tunisiensis]
MRRRKFIIIFTLMFIFSFFNLHTYAGTSFEPINVYNIVNELSSKEYKGRLVGEDGNLKAQKYIEEYFKSIGLDPGGDNGTYLQSFEIITPLLDGSCYFKIYDLKGKKVKEYAYGTEFKEMPYGASAPGTVLGRAKTELSSKGNILLSSGGKISEMASDYENDLALKTKGISAVVYSSNMNYRFRSPYKLQSDYARGIVKVMVTDKVFKELLDFSNKGYTFEIKSSLDIKKVTASNVIGMIKGKKPNLPPIILSAHFDHVGFDADGVIYPGAFDNASGTAFLLELARVLKSSGKNDRTIIFAAFNGEEVGLVGSEYFVNHPPVDINNGECINFDMVGAVKNIPLSILTYGADESFSREIEDIARKLQINTNLLNENNSDHGPFCIKGINAVTLIHDDTTKIHTPEDTIKNFNMEKTEEVFAVVSSYLKTKDVKVAFSYKVQNSSNMRNFIILSMCFLLLFVLIYYSKRESIEKR